MSVQDRINRIINGLDDVVYNAQKTAVVEIYGSLEKRIFNEGEDKNETSIGQYSTKPLLIGAKSFRNKTAANQFFKSDEAFTDDTQGFRTLKNNKVAYLLPGGYKKFRSLNGLQNNRVDLKFNGNLVGSIKYDEDAIFFTDKNQVKIAEGNEKRFGKRIFAPSEKEKNIFIKILNEDLSKLFKG